MLFETVVYDEISDYLLYFGSPWYFCNILKALFFLKVIKFVIPVLIIIACTVFVWLIILLYIICLSLVCLFGGSNGDQKKNLTDSTLTVHVW